MTVDYAAVTQRQQKVWSLGDYGRIGSRLSWIGEVLVRDLDVHPGERVLDVAAGNGNASLPAARRFAEVLATDYVPELLDEAVRRAQAEGVELSVRVADAQDLPFEAASYDVVLLATNHDAFDYAMIGRNAKLIVDTRGVFLEPAANVVKA